MTILDVNKEIKKKLAKASNVLVMGHKDIDLDALGASLAIYQYAKVIGKETYIIIDDLKLELGVKKALEKVRERYIITRSKNIRKKITKNTLLVIVDTNKEGLLQNYSIYNICKNIMIIDHHGLGENTVEKGYKVIDFNASSTCEMLAEFLHHNRIKIDNDLATILLAGIVLDTNNFVLKTNAKTFEVSYQLSLNGADSRDVQYLLKQDLKDYIARQKVITGVKTINDIAISKGGYRQKYRREDLAKIADTILLFKGIEASFVIGRTEDNTIGISARSMGNINVGKLLEMLGGGGDVHEAAAKISNVTLDDIYLEVTKLIKML